MGGAGGYIPKRCVVSRGCIDHGPRDTRRNRQAKSIRGVENACKFSEKAVDKAWRGTAEIGSLPTQLGMARGLGIVATESSAEVAVENTAGTTMARVRKRNGTTAEYDEGKVAHEIAMAVQAAGEGDPALAQELAEVVTFFLEKHHGSTSAAATPGGARHRRRETVVDPEQIADMIERVLLETAPPAVAKAFILRRQRRQEVAETIVVHRPPSYSQMRLFPDDSLTVEADSTAEAHHWDRMKIVEALTRESDVAPLVAEKIAQRVEERLFNSGLKRVTSGLIRELINAELFELGLTTHRDRQAVVGIPKFDLEEAVLRGRRDGGTFRDPADLDRYVAESVLQRYALQDVHSPEVAAAHVDGRIHLHGLGAPLRLFSLRICPEGIKFGWPPRPGRHGASTTTAVPADMADRIGPPKTEEQFFALLRRFAEECLELVTDTVTLTQMSLVLAPLGARKDAQGRRELVRRAIGALSGRIAPRLRIEWPVDVPPAMRGFPAIGLGGTADAKLTLGDLGPLVREMARDAVLMQLEGAHQALLAPDLAVSADAEALGQPDAHSVLELAADCASRHGAPRFHFARPARRPSRGALGEWRDQMGHTTLSAECDCAAVAVTLNLPQAAYRAGRGNHDAFSAECEQLLALARKAVSERFQFLLGSLARFANPLLAVGRESSQTPAHPASFDLRHAHGRLELLGLAEAMAYLSRERERKRGTQLPLFGDGPGFDESTSESAAGAGAAADSAADASVKSGFGFKMPAIGSAPDFTDDPSTRGGLRAVSYLAFALKEQVLQSVIELRLGDGRDKVVAQRLRRIDARTFPAHTQALVEMGALAAIGGYSPGVALPGAADPLSRLMRESRFHTMLDTNTEIVVPPICPTHSPRTLLETIKQAVWRSAVHGVTFPVFAVSCSACGDCRSTPIAIPACCPTCGHPSPDYGWLTGNIFENHPIP